MTGLFEGECRKCKAQGLVRGNGQCNPCSGFEPVDRAVDKRRAIKGKARAKFFADRG